MTLSQLIGTESMENHSTLHNEERTAINTNTTSITSGSNPGHTHTLAAGATDVTASAAEVNILDGVTSSTAELNILDGVTASTTEINRLSGITSAVVGINDEQTISAKTLTLPQINDTSSDHQYVFAVNELAADRTVTLPLLTGNDEFVFKDHTQTLTNKTLTSPTLTTPTIQGSVTGWINCTETLTYASSTTITIATGGASRWKKGDKLKITQTTDKYFYVIGVADTLLTVTGGSDYTVANAAITAASYCREGTAIGFPDYFNISVDSWSTSGTAFTNAPTTPLFRMSIVENKCWLWAVFLTNATSGGTGQFRVTVNSNQIPNRVDSSLGNAMNVSSLSSTGVAYIYDTNVIAIMKYDATAIAGNSAYFDMSLWYMY